MFENIISALKQNKIHLPVWLGVWVARIPYSWRPIAGKVYGQRISQIKAFDKMSSTERKEFIFQQMYSIVKYSIENIPFYQQYYQKRGFTLEKLKSFEDLSQIPVISKEELIEVDISERSNEQVEKILVNTGGSSGKTLSFYIEPSAIGHEFAHGESMWKELGFKPYNVRLIVIGRSKVLNGVDYEFARNCFSLDMYQPYINNKERLIKMLRKHTCDYIQGYPSVLAGFADFCDENPELLGIIQKNLKGVFLNSEFPYPIYRDCIERVFNVTTQAFYGHTERCIMAFEKKGVRNVYYPFQTYGYTEALRRDDGHYDLVGTSYFNHASPLIRYNTGDIVDNPIYENGILISFEIIEGRSGQFILDKDGRGISLTGLIMGRHHPIFDYCDHIQVKQYAPGMAVVMYVPKKNKIIEDPSSLFDSSNVNVDFSFEMIERPIRTKNGKINLLVKE